MDKILRVTVAASGVFIVIVSLTHIALGQSWIPNTIPVTASLDSEHRFYASIFLMYGVALLWCARDLSTRRQLFHFLLLTLFIGGLARVVSVFAAGCPHPLFLLRGVIELVVPPLLWYFSDAQSRQRADQCSCTPRLRIGPVAFTAVAQSRAQWRFVGLAHANCCDSVPPAARHNTTMVHRRRSLFAAVD